VYTGFKPAFVMLKEQMILQWRMAMYDNKRIGFNPEMKDYDANDSRRTNNNIL
jgi:hypothetical protein